MVQVADQVNMKLISQLISSISRVLQKLLKYFNGTAVSTFPTLASLILFVNFGLNLNDSKSVML